MAADRVRDFVRTKLRLSKTDETNCLIAVEHHCRAVERWSGQLQLYGMASPVTVDEATIPLRVSIPRRFGGMAVGEAHRLDASLLADHRNYLLIGDPGAGKTTTLKRLVRLTLRGNQDSAAPSFPVVLRLRELSLEHNLLSAIASALGLPVSTRTRTFTTLSGATMTRHELCLGDWSLDHAVVELLDHMRAVLVLDALDELHPMLRQGVEHEIAWLARNSEHAKLIATCRTGDYTTLIEGLDVVEVCPLSGADVATFAQRWLVRPDKFLQTLSDLPIHDLRERPLFLAQLLILYTRYGSLLSPPASLYRMIVRLALEDWDQQRGITRASAYAGFPPERKHDFLAALAFHLTVVQRRITFSEADFLHAYGELSGQFLLPEQSGQHILTELESHTGLITAVGVSGFAFSHHSLQEYLCAEYLVRQPALPGNHPVDQIPGPLAIAVSLSASPSDWLAQVLIGTRAEFTVDGLKLFLARLATERPAYGVSVGLGFALLHLLSRSIRDAELREMTEALLETPPVLASVTLALDHFALTEQEAPGGWMPMRLQNRVSEVHGLTLPDAIVVPAHIVTRSRRGGSTDEPHRPATEH